MSTLVFNFLAQQVKSPGSGVDKFFKFTETTFEEHIVSLIGVLLPCVEDAVAITWGLPCFYKYLNTIELVDDRSIAVVIEITDSIKTKLIENIPDSRKRYHFINALCE